MNTNLFKKIIVNDNEIELDQLYANNGKYKLGNGVEKATVKFFFNDGVEKRIPEKVFAGNSQIVSIDLSNDVTVDDGALAGLDNLSEESKQKLLTNENFNSDAFKYNITIGDIYWSIQPGKSYGLWEITEKNPSVLPELNIAVPGFPRETIEFTSSFPRVATIDNTGNITIGENGETTIAANISETNEFNSAVISFRLVVNVQEPVIPDVPKYYFSYGQTEITADNYTTANDVQEIEEYPEESTYEAPATGYVYVLVKDDKTVQFVDPGFDDANITTVDTEANIEGYKVYRSAKIVETGIIKIKIS